MAVEYPIAEITNALTRYQPPRQILQRINIPSSPVYPEDIVDFTKIETANPMPTYSQIVKHQFISNNLVNGKGVFIDLQI